jgi:hypothetical protein
VFAIGLATFHSIGGIDDSALDLSAGSIRYGIELGPFYSKQASQSAQPEVTGIVLQNTINHQPFLDLRPFRTTPMNESVSYSMLPGKFEKLPIAQASETVFGSQP